jgi:predicted O-linked N-acetylglucosamine transferase (SPINDLY family)
LASAWLGRANVLTKLKRHPEAAAAYAEVLRIDPTCPFIKGMLLHQRMLLCEWSGIMPLIGEIEEDIASGKLSAEPFGWQAVATSPRSLQLCAELFNKHRFPPSVAAYPQRHQSPDKKIRIGYSSGEFRDQATSHLIVGVLETHDRSQFEVYAFDNGWDDQSLIRRRIEAAVSGIIDISQLGDESAIEAIRECDIDILVNLNGYFGEERTRLFARRAAPIQVNYLGFPGTLGANYIDYLIADRLVIPPGHERFYSEKIAFLPGCYQANDRNRPIANSTLNRADCGLSQDSFVFCCFNNGYKIITQCIRLLDAHSQKG